MRTPISILTCLLLTAGLIGSVRAERGVTRPAEHFGFRPGADGRLASWAQLVSYYEKLGEESDRVQTRELGRTTLDAPFLLVTISSPENLARADRLQEISARLADPRGLSEQEVDVLVAEGRTVVAVTAGLHSTEVASAQMAARLAYFLASSSEAQVERILDNVVFLLFPSFNPDGHKMVVDWAEKTNGTQFQGASYPDLYHHYCGHDNNRDGYMLNLAESRMFSRVMYHEWRPQLYLDVHQMGGYGARLYVPPYYDPIHPNVDPLIWREHQLVGARMALDLERAGIRGVESGAPYDAWWMASFHMITNYHNIAGMLTETASAMAAWPIQIHPHQLRPGGRGRPRYAAQRSFPNPWPGGLWTMADMIRQQEISTLSLLEIAADNRELWLSNMALKAARNVERGRSEAPYAYIVPARQHDGETAARLVATLMRGGVEAHRARKEFAVGNRAFEAGDYVISLAQPLRAYVKSLLEPIRYPDGEWTRRRDGSPLRPYDMAAFNLAEHMGVAVHGAEEKFDADLEKLDGPPRASGRVNGADDATLWTLRPETNASFKAVNRELGEQVVVNRLIFDMEDWGAGTFVIEDNRRSIERLADELGLEFGEAPPEMEIGLLQLDLPRIGIYRGPRGNMDEGWTRYVLDEWGFRYERVGPKEIRRGELNRRYDVIVFADATSEAIMGDNEDEEKEGEGSEIDEYPRVFLPPEYSEGLQDEGIEALKEFARIGGTLVFFDTACEFAIEKFGLPVRNVVAGLASTEYYCPGSTLRVEVDTTHELGWGMPREALVLNWGSPVFAIEPSAKNASIAAPIIYANEDLLASGWLIGEEKIAGKAALIEAAYGKGKIVLVGFRCQHRAQTHGTYKIFFNALYSSVRTSFESFDRMTFR